MTEVGSVLYVLMCGCPAARDAGTLIDLALRDHWKVCAIASPDGLKFIDPVSLERQTGHPVRSEYKHPSDPDILPPASAMIVAPATTNTINKWAAGISDTLPLGLLVEGLGKGVPIIAAPFTNHAQAAHPAFSESVGKLRTWGVTVLCGDAFYPLHSPGTGEDHARRFPWMLVWDAFLRRLGSGGPRVDERGQHSRAPAVWPGRR